MGKESATSDNKTVTLMLYTDFFYALNHLVKRCSSIKKSIFIIIQCTKALITMFCIKYFSLCSVRFKAIFQQTQERLKSVQGIKSLRSKCTSKVFQPNTAIVNTEPELMYEQHCDHTNAYIHDCTTSERRNLSWLVVYHFGQV